MAEIWQGPLGHLLPYHHPVELAQRVAYLDYMAEGRYQVGVGIGVLLTDHGREKPPGRRCLEGLAQLP